MEYNRIAYGIRINGFTDMVEPEQQTSSMYAEPKQQTSRMYAELKQEEKRNERTVGAC